MVDVSQNKVMQVHVVYGRREQAIQAKLGLDKIVQGWLGYVGQCRVGQLGYARVDLGQAKVVQINDRVGQVRLGSLDQIK